MMIIMQTLRSLRGSFVVLRRTFVVARSAFCDEAIQALTFLCVFFLLTTSAFAIEQEPYPFTSTTDANRFYSLTQEIRCVVCQNQNIADSEAPLANDLRNKVYAMVLAHQSDEEIKEYLVKRYGEFILLRPRFNKSTGILWILPFAMLGTGLAALLFRVTRKR